MMNNIMLSLILVCTLVAGCNGKKQVMLKENEFYVCSMDPQVMEKQPGFCPICKMQLTKATIDISQMHHVELNEEQIKLANIKTAPVGSGAMGSGTVLNGVFAINQNTTEQVSARIKGRIEHLYFKVNGSAVSKGDKLFDLYSPELLQAQEEYLLSLAKGKLLGAGSNGIVSASRNKLTLWGLDEGQIKKLEQTGLPRATNTIYSRSAGVIIDIALKEGNYVNEGSEVYKIADLSSLWVEAQLYTNEFALLKTGQEVIVTPEAFPDDQIEGVVAFSNPELSQQSKINLIRIVVNNTSMRYRPGMQAYIKVKATEQQVMTLPVNAIIQNAQNSIVWVQTQEHIFEPRKVTSGIQNGGRVEILSGLADGEIVVVSGAYLLNSEYIFKHGMNPMDKMNHPKAKM